MEDSSYLIYTVQHFSTFKKIILGCSFIFRFIQQTFFLHPARPLVDDLDSESYYHCTKYMSRESLHLTPAWREPPPCNTRRQGAIGGRTAAASHHVHMGNLIGPGPFGSDDSTGHYRKLSLHITCGIETCNKACLSQTSQSLRPVSWRLESSTDAYTAAHGTGLDIIFASYSIQL